MIPCLCAGIICEELELRLRVSSKQSEWSPPGGSTVPLSFFVFLLWNLSFSSKVIICTSLIAQLVKNLPAVQETGLIPGLGRSAGGGLGYSLQYSWVSLVTQLEEDPLEKGKGTHPSILA